MKPKFQSIIDIPSKAAYIRVKKKLQALGEKIHYSIENNDVYESYPVIYFADPYWAGNKYSVGNSISYKDFIKKSFTELREEVQKLPENQVNNKTLRDLYEASTCTEWKNDLGNLIKENFLKKDDECYPIPNGVIDKFHERCSKEQKDAVKMAGIVITERSPFVDKFTPNAIDDMSRTLFGSRTTFQIAYGAIPEKIAHLRGKSFYVSSALKVVLHEGSGNSTIIELKFK